LARDVGLTGSYTVIFKAVEAFIFLTR